MRIYNIYIYTYIYNICIFCLLPIPYRGSSVWPLSDRQEQVTGAAIRDDNEDRGNGERRVDLQGPLMRIYAASLHNIFIKFCITGWIRSMLRS